MNQINNDSRKDAKLARKNLCGLGVFAYTDVGEGREQDAEALREKMIIFMPRQPETWSH
jgi:hypothetical protein